MEFWELGRTNLQVLSRGTESCGGIMLCRLTGIGTLFKIVSRNLTKEVHTKTSLVLPSIFVQFWYPYWQLPIQVTQMFKILTEPKTI